MRPEPKPVFELDGEITLATADAIAEGRLALTLAPGVWDRCRAAEERLARVIAQSRHVYGLTTGFGPLANRLVGADDILMLQRNLVHHLATGIGPALDWATARAMVLARLLSICRGASGAGEGSIRSLLGLLNSGLAPVIPARGTVGASGDLTPLAHMVLCLQGRGEFLDRSGQRLAGDAGLRVAGLAPLDLARRDALALVNGTSAMTGIALRNSMSGARLCDWSLALTALMAECMDGRLEAWAPDFAALRPHPGQARAATVLRTRVRDSARMVTRATAERCLAVDDIVTETEAGQDAYTLRCAPQVIGAVLDALDWHDRVLVIELNSVTDNPILPESGPVPALHGGNFMGQHVALTSDCLANSITVLAGLAERQIARITDERLNRGLPAFLHRGPAGLNSGFMGAQVTATALVAEMRTSGAAASQSISTNGANQDVVSLGTIAARLAMGKLRRCSEVQAILALCLAQAAELRGGPGLDGLSSAGRALVGWVRELSPPLSEDRPLGVEIASVATRIARQSPP